MAHLLSEGDEIVFVDWNTPIGYPVMPVSIKDDLLPKTKSLLRIIRVPQSVHNLVSEGSNRALIEPLARNVGIRRASPNSKWILSSNTDILFASPSGKNFREIFENLEENLWLSYRFEIPEFVWDGLDRRNPKLTSEFILAHYRDRSILNRIRVDSASDADFPIPDGVGDFQLATSYLWAKTTGFPEDMKKGWHVDTRLTLQMERISKNQPRLLNESDMVIFHQNHLRNTTAYHGVTETNSLLDVDKPYVNPTSWGLSDHDLGEIDLELEPKGIEHLNSIFHSGNSQITSDASDLSDLLKRLDYNLARTKFFLADEISILPKGSLVHCYTANVATQLALQEICASFEVEILFQDVKSIGRSGSDARFTKVSLLILDYGVESDHPIYSNFCGGEISVESLEAGLIALSTGQISKLYAPSTTRVMVIRAQNWATRELARKFLKLPLFNNYTAVMSGEIIPKPKLGSLQEVILSGGVTSDFGLSKDLIQLWQASNSRKVSVKIPDFVLQNLRRLPKPLRSQVIRIAKSVIRL